MMPGCDVVPTSVTSVVGASLFFTSFIACFDSNGDRAGVVDIVVTMFANGFRFVWYTLSVIDVFMRNLALLFVIDVWYVTCGYNTSLCLYTLLFTSYMKHDIKLTLYTFCNYWHT